MGMESTTRTAQASRFSERGQTVFRAYLGNFDGTTVFYHALATVGVLPAAGAAGTDVAYFRMADGISGRIMRFGAFFANTAFSDLGWAGGDVQGTLSLDVLATGGAAFANIGNIQWPQAAPLAAAAVPNDAVYEDVAVALAPAVAPYTYAGGDLFASYISIARVIAAGGILGEAVSFIDYTIDAIAQDASAAIVAYLNAL